MRSASAAWTAALGDFVVQHRVAIIAVSAAATVLAAVVGCCNCIPVLKVPGCSV